MTQTYFNLHCMMCGRAAGHVYRGRFSRAPAAPPLEFRGGRSRCGFCGGNVYLEAEDSPVTVRPIDLQLARQARQAS